MPSPARTLTFDVFTSPKFVEATSDEPRALYPNGAAVYYGSSQIGLTTSTGTLLTTGTVFTSDVYLVAAGRATVDDTPSPRQTGGGALVALSDVVGVPSDRQIVRYNATSGKFVFKDPYLIDVRDYGAVFNNSTDDTAAIQAALNAAVVTVTGVSPGNDYAARIVQLPPGRGIVTTITVPANVQLRGHGPSATYLYRNVGALTTPVVNITSGTVQQVLSDFGIINQDTDVDCIDLSNGGGPAILGDARVVVRNVVCVGGRDGIAATSGNGNELRLERVTTQRTARHGFNISTTDYFLDGCTAAASGYGELAAYNGSPTCGFQLGGANGRVYGCKAYGALGAGNGYGFYVVGSGRHQIAACEAQDCKSAGFLVAGNDSVLSSCTADSCGGKGFEVGGNNIVLSACHCVARGGGLYATSFALRFSPGSSAGSQIRGFTTDNVKLYFQDASPTGSSVPDGVFIDARNRLGAQNPAYAATVTPDPWAGEDVVVGTLTGNVSIGNPSTPGDGTSTPYPRGMKLRFALTQDATGGRTVTFGTAYKTTAAVPTTASSVTVIGFVYDGANWRELTRATT